MVEDRGDWGDGKVRVGHPFLAQKARRGTTFIGRKSGGPLFSPSTHYIDSTYSPNIVIHRV